MSEKPAARTMFPNDDFSNDEQHKQRTQSCQYYSLDQFVNQYDQQLRNPSGMVFHYSDRFPKMCMNMYFYEDIMKIAEKHIGNYRTRWFDFDQLHSEFSLNESSVPWDCSVLQSVQPIRPPKELCNVKNNNKHDHFTNNHILNEIVQTSTPSSIESFSASISSSDFEEPVTPIKKISKINEDFKKSPKKKYTNVKKLQEENNNNNNNNTNYAFEDDDIKNRSISSNSSRSDVTDEKIVSYAEVIKQTKPKQSVKAEIINEKFKKQPMRSHRIPPSKKSSIKIPDAPFLPYYQYCVFCKNNGEEESIYRTHVVKDESKNVKCPFLSMYTCPQCKATGTKAHTISKCPLLINKNNINKLNNKNY